MTLPTKTLPQFVSDMTATWNAETGIVATFTSGDVLLALMQAVAGQLDFLQAKVATVLKLTRAQTSTGADLDTWMAQFDFARLQATYATGVVTFSTALPATTTISVPVGSIVQTAGGGYQYTVVADTTQSSYNASANAYVIPAGASSISATVQATVAGSASNVAANQITQMGSSIPGVYSVTNGASILNGIDAETDTALRGRFVLYLATLAKATKAAILAAAYGVQQGLEVTAIENQQADGTALPGCFTLVVDDGSGAPPASTIAAVYAAVDATRAFSVQPFVIAPTILTVTIAITVRLAANVVVATTITAIQQVISNIINESGPGATLYVSAVDSTALLVTGVTAVRPGTMINGTAADLTPTASQEIRTTVSNVTVTIY